jgi:hypothetical protein
MGGCESGDTGGDENGWSRHQQIPALRCGMETDGLVWGGGFVRCFVSPE